MHPRPPPPPPPPPRPPRVTDAHLAQATGARIEAPRGWVRGQMALQLPERLLESQAYDPLSEHRGLDEGHGQPIRHCSMLRCSMKDQGTPVLPASSRKPQPGA